MVSKKVVVSSIVGVLGGLAFIFGVAGFFSGVKDGSGTFWYATDYSYCRWYSTPATGLGIVGCFFMLAAQIISNIGGGCVCCCIKHPLISGSKTTAILCLILSWVLTIMSSIFLFLGGIYNSGSIHMQLDVYTDGTIVCYYPAKWPLVVGGILSLFATGIAICFYITANPNASSTNEPQSNNVNIQMPTANYKQSGIPAAAAVGIPPGSYQAGVPSPGYY